MSAAAVLVELDEVVERALAVDVDSLTPEELAAFTFGLHRARNRLTVAASNSTSQWETRGEWWLDGTLSPSIGLGRDTHSSRETAKTELHRARRLQDMPATRQAVLDGRLSTDHIDLFIRYATPARWAHFEANEQALVDIIASQTLFDDARRLVRRWADLVDDELDVEPRAITPSKVFRSRSSDSGELKIDGLFNNIDSEILDNETKRLASQIRAADKAAGITRTPAQVRAAAYVLMAQRSASADGVTARPVFQVRLGDRTTRQVCELASGIVVRPHDLLPYIDAAVMETFFFDGPKTIIAKSHLRTFKGALRKAILVRDRRCEHSSGCPVPSVDCDIDHRVPWSEGGETSQFNGGPMCKRQNRHAEFAGVRVPAAPERSITRRDYAIVRLSWSILAGNDDDGPESWLREQGSNLRPAD